MSIRKYLETQPLHDITRYHARVDLEKDAVPFVATPRKHPYDDEKVLLVQDPFGTNTMFYEFTLDDIIQVEDMPSVGTDTGKTVKMARFWIRKGSLGLRYEPFEVDEPLRFFHDSEILRQTINLR
jgi:hypothetical protein